MTSTARAPVICAGSNEQIGRSQGEQLAEQVRASEDLLDELEAFRLAKPAWLPFTLYRWIARRKARSTWRKFLDIRAPDMAERLGGIAAGSGARLDELQLLNLMEPILSDLTPISIAGPPHGCSAVAIRGSRSLDGRPIIARNFDYLPMVQPFYALREIRPDRGFRSLEFTVAPLVGAIDGINEKGLAITNNYAYVTDHGEPCATIAMAISQALAECADVAAAEAFFASRRIWGGGILMLADAGGDLASLELSNTRHAVRRPGTDDAIFHTNRFFPGAMSEVEIADDRHYSARAAVALRGLRIHQSADERNARLAHLFDQHKFPLSRDDLAGVLADHGASGEPSLDSICMHSAYWFTTATLQLLPTERKMRVAFDSACEAELVDFEL